jgi:hypothetical protein
MDMTLALMSLNIMDKYTFAKVVNLLCLLGTIAWLARSPHWEPLVASIGLLGSLVAIEVFDQKQEQRRLRQIAPDDASSFNPEIRNLLTHISKLPKNDIQPEQIQGLVKRIASTIARIHFNRDDMPIPINAPRVYPDEATFDCGVCEAKKVDVYTTGYCPRCRFDSRSWMQIKS